MTRKDAEDKRDYWLAKMIDSRVGTEDWKYASMMVDKYESVLDNMPKEDVEARMKLKSYRIW